MCGTARGALGRQSDRRDGEGRRAKGAKSHPLALTQLLVGYHAVKAAMGTRAY